MAALLALVVAAPAAAAGPELGGRVAAIHLPIRWELDPHTFTITNQSTIPARVTLELTEGAGWHVDAEAFSLAIDGSQQVTITEAGEDAGIITATLRGEGLTGFDVAAIAFEVGVRHAAWYERAAGWLPLGLMLLLLAVGLALRLLLRRRRW